MYKNWAVAEAKSHFSELLNQSINSPQFIENRGKKVSVIVSFELFKDYEKLKAEKSPSNRIKNFLITSEKLQKSGGASIKISSRKNRTQIKLG